MNRKLWYKKAAGVWEEAIPIGNGRVGAMVFSGAVSDRFQINEETLWSGYPDMVKDKHSMSDIRKIRDLIHKKEYKAATDMTSDVMFGVTSQAYVSYGSMFIDIVNSPDTVTDYKRELDLETGVVKTEYKLDGKCVTKEAFVSLTDDVMAIKIKSETPLDFHIYQAVEMQHSVEYTPDTVTVSGKCPTYIDFEERYAKYDEDKESVRFCSRIRAISKGRTYSGGNSIWIDKADEVVILFSIKTSFNGYNKMPVSEGKEYVNSSLEALNKAAEFSFEELKEHHTNEYKKYFDRVSLKIDGENFDSIPTDERIKNVSDGITDNGLTTLLFDYSRYLTIASSLCGTQPGTLQGIWCYHVFAPWNCNYTMNINTQMNYWPTETMNLGECHMPLFKMLREFSEKGNVLGLRGWASWHNSDLWRFNCGATKGVLWGFWLMGGFWSTRHIWEHYIHTGDKEFLKEYYPVMVEATKFLEDWMYENQEGRLVTGPSTSPENEFVYNGEKCCVCEGSAMDMSIIYDLFDKTIKASCVLGEDSKHLEEIKSKLAPVKIGKDGRILEWGEEFEENELGHRHISHLYGFYPADIMEYEKYAEPVRKTLETRLENGGGHTGWSNAWIANVYARLKDGEKVNRHIKNMFKKSIYPNMFDAHPPFQIDGNFGIAAAICEALMQSHTGRIELLPALPEEWKSGEVKGFVTRTGKIIDFSWENGQITHQNIKDNK